MVVISGVVIERSSALHVARLDRTSAAPVLVNASERRRGAEEISRGRHRTRNASTAVTGRAFRIAPAPAIDRTRPEVGLPRPRMRAEDRVAVGLELV